MRDIGPSFVLDETVASARSSGCSTAGASSRGRRGTRTSQINRCVADLAGRAGCVSALVNEGGAIHVDGLGTVLVTETVQLDPFRNPGLDKAAVEAELARTIGATHVIWLPRGLTRDNGEFGTRGHVDIVATDRRTGTAARPRAERRATPTTPCHARSWTCCATAATRAARLDDHRVPAPKTLRDDEGWVDYSYINHVVVNGGVIGCAFDDPNDEIAGDTAGRGVSRSRGRACSTPARSSPAAAASTASPNSSRRSVDG